MQKHLTALLPLLLFATACATTTTAPRTAMWAATPSLPQPEHVVIVIFENKSYEDIIDSPSAPYITSLARQGASLNFYSFHHPSQPNYFELFAGTTTLTMQDGTTYVVDDDACLPQLSTTPNLADAFPGQFLGYAEAFDPADPTACSFGGAPPYYATRHAPWTGFVSSLPVSRTFTDFTKTDFSQLPLVSIVAPDVINDMHQLETEPPAGTCPDQILAQQVTNGDTWLHTNLDRYLKWAMTNNSLLIITFDENSRQGQEHYPSGSTSFSPPANHIATILVGPMVIPGSNGGNVFYNHHDLLKTILTMYGKEPIGGAATAQVIQGIWQKPQP